MLMSGEMSDEKPRELYLKEKIDRWMVNEGYRRLYYFQRPPVVLQYANCEQICSSFLNIAYHGVRVWHDELQLDGELELRILEIFREAYTNVFYRTSPSVQEAFSVPHFQSHDQPRWSSM